MNHQRSLPPLLMCRLQKRACCISDMRLPRGDTLLTRFGDTRVEPELDGMSGEPTVCCADLRRARC